MACLPTKTTLGYFCSGFINQWPVERNISMENGANKQENQHQLRDVLKFTSIQENMMACRVHVSLIYKRREGNCVVRQGKTREPKKHMKNVLSFPMKHLFVFGTVPNQLFRPSLKFNTLLQFNGSTLSTISSLLAYIIVIAEALSSFQLSALGVHIFAGYWVGPDYEDGWGYVEAAAVRVCYQ